jgi:hypothetical protein
VKGGKKISLHHQYSTTRERVIMKQQDDVVMQDSGIKQVWNERQEKENRHARRELKALGLVPDPESHAGWVPGTVRYFNRHQPLES